MEDPPNHGNDKTPDAAAESEKKNPHNHLMMKSLLLKPGLRVVGKMVQEVGALQSDVAADLEGVIAPVTPGHATPQQPMDMFAKTSMALFNSVVVYAIADVRTLIRQHRDRILGGDAVIQELMTLPITDVNVMMIIIANLPVLQELMKKGLIDFYLSAVMRYRSELAQEAEEKLDESKRAMRESLPSANPGNRRRRRSIYDALPRNQTEEREEEEDHPVSVPQRIPVTLEVFDDENSSKELVYGIAVNRETKSIIIAFRGSVTSRDWLMDGKVFLTSVPNPILEQPTGGPVNKSQAHRNASPTLPQSKYIGLHTGFYEYLFVTKGKDDVNKYTQILQSLQRLFDKEKTLRTFAITVTGHSLGGALATIFSFYFVLEPMCALLPVTCINFASPKCGNIQFARAFQELELQKRLFCLRVANDRDLITERPDRLTCWTFCLQNAIFRHVGIELLLYPPISSQKKTANPQDDESKEKKAGYRIRYPRIRRSRLSQFSDDFLVSVLHTLRCTASVTCGCCIHDYMQWHSCDEYLNRVDHAGSALQALPIEQIHDSYYQVVSEESESFSFPAPLSILKTDEP